MSTKALLDLKKQIVSLKSEFEKFSRSKAGIPGGDYKIVPTGDISAEFGADGRTLNIDASGLNNPLYIVAALHANNEDAPYIDAHANVSNFEGAWTTSVTWEVRKDGPSGQLLQVATAPPYEVVTESSILKSGTYANPRMLVNDAGNVWIGLTATNSIGRTSERTSELLIGHNLGSFSFEVDGTTNVGMSILSHFETEISWDMGDGNVLTTAEPDTGDGFLNTINHTYVGAGPYTVTITMPLRYIRAITAQNCGITTDIDAFSFLRDGVNIGWKGANQLQTLQLRNNSIGGTLPAEWGDFEVLDLIDIRGNLLTGTMPAAWGNSKSITRIFLTGNPAMAGVIPPEWGNMTQLTALDIGDCGLAGEIPQSLAQATQLNRFVVRDNLLSGPLPDSFRLLTLMEIFDISDNAFTGAFPPSWSSWTLLEWLFANGNQISGVVPTEWTTMTALQRVRLYDNLLTGAAGHMVSVPALHEYEIHNNQLTTADVDNLLLIVDTTSLTVYPPALDLTTSEPAAPTVGDQYWNTATGTTSITAQAVTTNTPYEWSGAAWTVVSGLQSDQPNFRTDGQTPAAPPTGGGTNANYVSILSKNWGLSTDP